MDVHPIIKCKPSNMIFYHKIERFGNDSSKLKIKEKKEYQHNYKTHTLKYEKYIIL